MRQVIFPIVDMCPMCFPIENDCENANTLAHHGVHLVVAHFEKEVEVEGYREV